MFRDADSVLDLARSLRWHAALVPPSDGGLVHAEGAGQVDQTEVAGAEGPAKRLLHGLLVAQLTTNVKEEVARLVNDSDSAVALPATFMAAEKIERIYTMRQPRRPHHIADWMVRRNLRPVDVATELGADKSVVSRWLNGTTPGVEYQEKLAALFQIEPEALFRHPDDDWITRMFSHRTDEEIGKMKRLLEDLFPPRKESA